MHAETFVQNSAFEVSGRTAKSVNGSWCWRTVQIGDWIEAGTAYAVLTISGVSAGQQPGVSLAVGVLFSDVEGRVNDASLSTVGCGSNMQWSVGHGHSKGLEYLGNKWGTAYGPRLQNGDSIAMKVDMSDKTLRFAVNGVCYGSRGTFSAGRVSFAAAVERAGSSLRLETTEYLPSCLLAAGDTGSGGAAGTSAGGPTVSKASSRSRTSIMMVFAFSLNMAWLL